MDVLGSACLACCRHHAVYGQIVALCVDVDVKSCVGGCAGGVAPFVSPFTAGYAEVAACLVTGAGDCCDIVVRLSVSESQG